MKITRRSFLETGWRIGAALLAVAAGWTSWELLRPLKSAEATGPLNLGDLGKYQPNTATYVMAGRLYVVNTGKNILALSQKCPHLGCRVPFNDKTGRFECPCHGSVFTLDGTRVQGPTPRGMDQYQLSVDKSGELVVDLSKKIEGKA